MNAYQSNIAIFGILVCCLAGCKTFTPPEWAKGWMGGEPKVAESQFARPTRLAVIWSPAVLNTPGQTPTRGFGGRLYFYDAANNAVPVEGQLVVYAYDDSKRNGDGKTPDRKYAFTPEQFTEHYSPTELGASYSVWVPWDQVGCDQAEISLVPVFTASSGQLVVGQQSRNLLPGPQTESSVGEVQRFTSPTGLGAVQQASYQQDVRQMTTTFSPSAGLQELPRVQSPGVQEMSISLPGTLADRLAQAGPQQGPRRHHMLSAAATGQPPMQPTVTASPSPPATGFPRWSPPDPRLTRYARRGPQAPASPSPQPALGQPPRQPFPAAQPFALPSSPQ